MNPDFSVSFCRSTSAVIGALAISPILISSLSASTIAYYRFEEGTADVKPVFGVDVIVDSAGGDDNLRAFSNAAAPTYRANVPAPTVPLSGAANTLSADFAPNNDIFTNVAGPLVTGTYTNFTIEAYFQSDLLSANRTIVGRDDIGNPGQGVGPQSLFYLQTTNNAGSPRVRFEFIDNTGGTGTNRNIGAGITPLVTGTWYHVALVGDVVAQTATLYLDGVAQGSSTFTGGLFDPSPDSVWTIGRGRFNNSNGDFFDGRIDEVRISDTALLPSEFLNVPEPGAAMLASGGLLGLLGIRRRR